MPPSRKNSPKSSKDQSIAMGVSSSPLKEVTEPSFAESPKVTSRSGNRRLSEMDVNATNIDGVFSNLFEVIGQTNLESPSPNIRPHEIDMLAAEIVAVRDAKDLVEGRESALKAYASEVINLRLTMNGEDSVTTSGFLVSPENGVKLSKEVSLGKLTIDIDKLEKVLDTDQFNSITNLIHVYRTVTYPDGSTVEENKVSRELNEEALEKQLLLSNVGMEQILQATVSGKTRTAFYVRNL